MQLVLFGIPLAAVILLYYKNNPLNHDSWFINRRFMNWFPLGMTYAFLYMGRYNLNISKEALGSLMTKSDFGIIFGIGTAVYGFSFLFTGPMVDKLGGKKGILIAGIGSAIANGLMGIATWLYLTGKMEINLLYTYALLYGVNMHFQSYGATSIIKVKANWFHVRERGVFGAIFGTLISFGVYFAFDWGSAVVKALKAYSEKTPSFLGDLLGGIFSSPEATAQPFWAIFYVPAILIIFWVILDSIMVADKPEDVGFPAFDVADASSDDKDEDFSIWHLLKKFFTNPIMLLICFIELTSGVIRNGILQWYKIYAKEVALGGTTQFFLDNWGLIIAYAGIIGGFTAGAMSDKFFQSRRGPVAALCGGAIVIALIAMYFGVHSSPSTMGIAATIISAAVIGVHASMSGTAAADFAGKKNTGTASGVTDGFVYLGSSIQSVAIGYLSAQDWAYWPLFIIPFSVLGLYLSIRMWKKLPKATAAYIKKNEKVEADTEFEVAETVKA